MYMCMRMHMHPRRGYYPPPYTPLHPPRACLVGEATPPYPPVTPRPLPPAPTPRASSARL